MIKINQISSEKAVNALAKNYNTLHYTVKLAELLKSVYPLKNLEQASKYKLHKLVNDTLIKHYSGEEILKYKLYQEHMSKRHIVAAFEIKVNNSRADFLCINGNTTCFEIKSELDNLSKLKKQSSDYLMAFEYNYLLIDAQHLNKVKNLIPQNFGIWTYSDGKLKKEKKAMRSDEINPEIQLRLLTKKEKQTVFINTDGATKKILSIYNADVINEQFKRILKVRYKNRWDFIVANQSDIFPIDLQFFFNTNIHPRSIYYH